VVGGFASTRNGSLKSLAVLKPSLCGVSEPGAPRRSHCRLQSIENGEGGVMLESLATSSARADGS